MKLKCLNGGSVGRLLKAICPRADDRVVQMFTAEWWGRGGAEGAEGAARRRGAAALLVVWAAREAGAARLAWMEVWRAGAAGPAGALPGAGPAGEPINATAWCDHPCVALAACMDPALW